jgi:hypothetical protein
LSPAGTEGNGGGITINGTTATDLHQGSTTTTTYHEVHLWATNTGTVSEILILGVGYATGGAIAQTDLFHYEVDPDQTIYISPGFTLKGNATARDISGALVSTNTTVNVAGYVNVIDQS